MSNNAFSYKQNNGENGISYSFYDNIQSQSIVTSDTQVHHDCKHMNEAKIVERSKVVWDFFKCFDTFSPSLPEETLALLVPAYFNKYFLFDQRQCNLAF